MTPLRSVLYVPGNRPDLMEKAVRYDADAVALVLEDSVPKDKRSEARVYVARQIEAYAEQGVQCFVKINDFQSGQLEQDLSAIVVPGVSALIVPKVNSRSEVDRIVGLIDEAEHEAGLASGEVGLFLLIETPSAVLEVGEIAKASPRIATLICGAAEGGDLAGALGISWSADGRERIPILTQVNVAARAAGRLAPLDGVWTRIGDLEGLEADCRLARGLGFGAKLAVHPEQIPVINRVFSPSQEDVARQRAILEAFEVALAEGSASIVVDGQFIDYAMAESARRIVEFAESLEHRSKQS